MTNRTELVALLREVASELEKGRVRDDPTKLQKLDALMSIYAWECMQPVAPEEMDAAAYLKGLRLVWGILHPEPQTPAMLSAAYAVRRNQ